MRTSVGESMKVGRTERTGGQGRQVQTRRIGFRLGEMDGRTL